MAWNKAARASAFTVFGDHHSSQPESAEYAGHATLLERDVSDDIDTKEYEALRQRMLDAESRAEQAEADANEQRLHYDKLFDEAVEIRKQRDQARQEAAKLREVLGKVDTIACEFACCDDHEMWRAMKYIHEIVQDAPLHSSDAPASERKTLWTARATDYDPLPDVAEEDRPAMEAELKKRAEELRGTAPVPADRPEPRASDDAASEALIDRIVPPMESLPETEENQYPAEAALYHDRERIRQELRAELSQPAPAPEPSESPAVPDGYVLVPKEPTLEMVENGKEYIYSDMTAYALWKVMLAATPTPDEGEG